MYQYDIYFYENKRSAGGNDLVAAIVSIITAIPGVFLLIVLSLIGSWLFWLFLFAEIALLLLFVMMVIKIKRRSGAGDFIAVYSGRLFASDEKTTKKQMAVFVYAYLLADGSRSLPSLPPQMVKDAQEQAEALRNYRGTDPSFAVNEIGTATLEESSDGCVLKYSPLLAGQNLPVTRQIDIIGDGIFKPYAAGADLAVRTKPDVYASYLAYVHQLRLLAEYIYGHDIPPIPAALKGSKLAALLLGAVYEDDTVMENPEEE